MNQALTSLWQLWTFSRERIRGKLGVPSEYLVQTFQVNCQTKPNQTIPNQTKPNQTKQNYLSFSITLKFAWMSIICAFPFVQSRSVHTKSSWSGGLKEPSAICKVCSEEKSHNWAKLGWPNLTRSNWSVSLSPLQYTQEYFEALGNWVGTKASKLQDLENTFQLENAIFVPWKINLANFPPSHCIVWMSSVFELKSSIKLLPQTFQHQFVAFKRGAANILWATLSNSVDSRKPFLRKGDISLDNVHRGGGQGEFKSFGQCFP